jgi:hypothetical protein
MDRRGSIRLPTVRNKLYRVDQDCIASESRNPILKILTSICAASAGNCISNSDTNMP